MNVLALLVKLAQDVCISSMRRSAQACFHAVLRGNAFISVAIAISELPGLCHVASTASKCMLIPLIRVTDANLDDPLGIQRTVACLPT